MVSAYKANRMIENNISSESDEGEIKSDFEADFQEELHNFPHILRFIQRMRDHIKKQNKKIAKLQNKLSEHVRTTSLKYSFSVSYSYILFYTFICSQKSKKLMEKKTLIDYGTQTNPLEYEKESCQDWNVNNDKTSTSIIQQVKEVAESALLQTGFVYEETSGLYYDYNSGYYYDAVSIYAITVLNFH